MLTVMLLLLLVVERCGYCQYVIDTSSTAHMTTFCQAADLTHDSTVRTIVRHQVM